MSSVERDERVERLSDDLLLEAFVAGCNRENELNDAELSPQNVRRGVAAAMRGVLARTLGAVPSPDGPDNDGTEWVCSTCGSTVTGPSRAPMCPKGCHLMDRAWIETMRGDEERNGTPDMDGRYPRRGSPDGGDLPAPRVERHPDWEGGWVLHFKTYSVAVAQLERKQRRDAAYAEAARDPAFCADMKALTHGVGALPSPREDTVTRVEVIDHRTGAEPFGRVFSAWDCRVALSYQDGGRTLKVFVDGEAPPPPDTLSDAERAEKLAGVRLARSGGGSALEGTGQ